MLYGILIQVIVVGLSPTVIRQGQPFNVGQTVLVAVLSELMQVQHTQLLQWSILTDYRQFLSMGGSFKVVQDVEKNLIPMKTSRSNTRQVVVHGQHSKHTPVQLQGVQWFN